MHNKYITTCRLGVRSIALLAICALASCDESKKYVPVEPDAPDCMGVYFDDANPTDFLFVPGEPADINITMHREKADVAADIEVICTSNVDGVVCPPTVHFDAGATEATLAINCEGMPLKTNAVIRLNLPDRYINHYSETLFDYQATAIVSQWEPANADGSPVKFYFTDNNYINYNNPKPTQACFKPIESEMMVLPGAGLIKINNFINSGIDMTFALSPSPYSDYTGLYRVSPDTHYMTMVDVYESDAYGDDWYNAWYLMTDPDEEGEEDFADCALTSLDGKEVIADYPQFFWYSDSYLYEYSVMRPKSASTPHSSASLGFNCITDDNNITIPSYFYIFFSWDGESGL